MPDLEQLIFAPTPTVHLVSVSVSASADGTFADGRAGKVQVTEVGLLGLKVAAGVMHDGFPAEHIDLIYNHNSAPAAAPRIAPSATLSGVSDELTADVLA